MTPLRSQSVSRLLCVGDLAADVAVTLADALSIGSDTDGTIALSGGGSAANVAAWAANAGLATTFVGAIGDDSLGGFLVDELRGHGVDVRPLRRGGARSRAVAAIVGPDGDRSLVSDLAHGVAATEDDYRDDWFDDVDWLHLTAYTYLADAGRALFGRLVAEAGRRSVPFSLDPSAAPLLAACASPAELTDAFAGAEVMFPSRDEAEFLTGEAEPATAANALLAVASCVAVTCGADGAHVASRGAEGFHVPAADGPVVNTLGCGDAFAAGFVAAVVAGLDARTAALAAVRTAARAAALPGAR